VVWTFVFCCCGCCFLLSLSSLASLHFRFIIWVFSFHLITLILNFIILGHIIHLHSRYGLRFINNILTFRNMSFGYLLIILSHAIGTLYIIWICGSWRWLKLSYISSWFFNCIYFLNIFHSLLEFLMSSSSVSIYWGFIFLNLLHFLFILLLSNLCFFSHLTFLTNILMLLKTINHKVSSTLPASLQIVKLLIFTTLRLILLYILLSLTLSLNLLLSLLWLLHNWRLLLLWLLELLFLWSRFKGIINSTCFRMVF